MTEEFPTGFYQLAVRVCRVAVALEALAIGRYVFLYRLYLPPCRQGIVAPPHCARLAGQGDRPTKNATGTGGLNDRMPDHGYREALLNGSARWREDMTCRQRHEAGNVYPYQTRASLSGLPVLHSLTAAQDLPCSADMPAHTAQSRATSAEWGWKNASASYLQVRAARGKRGCLLSA